MAINLLSQLLAQGRELRDLVGFNRRKALRFQESQLKKLLYNARKTAFGQAHGFEEILLAGDVYAAFAARVPAGDYSAMYPWWQRAYNGEKDVTWPGQVKFFAMSSGTTEAASKYIPVTRDMIKSINRTSARQVMSILKTDLPKDYLAKQHLMIGGSTDLNFNGTVWSGDLSGITTSHIPVWFQRFSKPGNEIKKQRDWHEKLSLIVNEAPKWDIVMIAGVPAWIKMLFEMIIKQHHLNSIHDIWPNLSVYVHGGVALEPYRKGLDRLMGKPIMYFETYLASEGFLAYQSRIDSGGMRLNFRNGIFYEFVPFNRDNFNENGELLPNAQIVSLADVSLDTPYAILITTCSGAWRYLIGDTIRFTDLEQCEIKITGRTKHFLSICGEHLSVDNMNQAIARLSEEFDAPLPEFTVKGIPYQGFFAHQWHIACDDPEVEVEALSRRLDELLCELNDDYAIERRHALKGIVVNLVPSSAFIDWMEQRGKLGSQNKVPRVMPDALYQSWLEFLDQRNGPAATHG